MAETVGLFGKHGQEQTSAGQGKRLPLDRQSSSTRTCSRTPCRRAKGHWHVLRHENPKRLVGRRGLLPLSFEPGVGCEAKLHIHIIHIIHKLYKEELLQDHFRFNMSAANFW